MTRVLVISGEGINCEAETAAAFALAHAHPVIVPVRDFLKRPQMLLEYQIFALPGGFSFGDEIISGQILGLALKDALKEIWPQFLERKGLAIGICNGFQILMKMGVFGPFTLAANTPHGFRNNWVELTVEKSNCVWTQGLEGEELFMPMRHGEGRLWTESAKRTERLESLKTQGQIVLRYFDDVNGSMDRIAGLSDPTGQILGLMPHPEAALAATLFPVKTKSGKNELHARLFRNAVQFAQENHR